RRVADQRSLAALRHSNGTNQETEQYDDGNNQWRNVDRTVLPQLAPHRPIHWLCRSDVVAGVADPGRFRYVRRCGIHVAASSWGVGTLCESCYGSRAVLLITAWH